MTKEISYEDATAFLQVLVEAYALPSFDFYQYLHNNIPSLKHVVRRGRYGKGDNIEYYTFIFNNGSQLQLHAGYRVDLAEVGL